MFKNYLNVSIRNLLKHKWNSLTNILCLGIGMSVCIIIFLWIQFHFVFDTFHQNIDDIYIVAGVGPNTPPALAPVLKNDYPEVLKASRFNSIGSFILMFEDKAFSEPLHAADASFLDIFSFPMITGSREDFFAGPNSILITQRMAEKYFGTEDPVGNTIQLDNRLSLEVTGVIENVPDNSSLRFNFLVPFELTEELWRSPKYLQSWSNKNAFTYVQLGNNTDYELVSEKISDCLIRGGDVEKSHIRLHPFSKLHVYGLRTGGGVIGIIILSSMIAITILVIACINFINLTTARATMRAVEIGMRKIVGAKKLDIIKQFYGESFILTIFSLLLALLLADTMLPIFNSFFNTNLSISLFNNDYLLLGIIGITIITALIAGSYPAFIMSSFLPVNVVKGKMFGGLKNYKLRRTLVVIQLTTSIILIISAIVIHKQINYVQGINTGFNRDNVITVNLKGAMREQHDAAKSEMLRHPDITHASLISRSPLHIYTNGKGWNWDGKSQSFNPLVTYFTTDYDFNSTFGIEMTHGKYFTPEEVTTASNLSRKVVINETLANFIGLENPVGTTISNYGSAYTIIGVVKNFNFKPLTRDIGPLMIFYESRNDSPTNYRMLAIKVDSDNIEPALEHIGGVFKSFNPDFPFEYSLLEEEHQAKYEPGKEISKFLGNLAILTILISCLGLLGLVSFSSYQRSKEIAIRRIFGSSVKSIITMLSKEIMILICVANLIAWPMSFLAMKLWLAEFSYQVSVGWTIFIGTGISSLVIAMLTISIIVIKASFANPVDSIRYE